MSDTIFRLQGRYFEQFEIGDVVVTAGRTITETDIVTFAGLTGDFNGIHMDETVAAAGPFGKRIAHGMLVQSIATGLAVRTGVIENTVMAFRTLSAKFSAAVFIGDTIHVKLEVSNKKALPRMGGGNITLKVSVINQDDKVIQRGEWVMLMESIKSP